MRTTMRCLQFAIATAALFVLAGYAPVAGAAPLPKVDICHIPPGNPDNFHTITVSENALPAHLAHGDLGGACNDLCATICDDGNACTVDDTGDCESEDCPPEPRAPTDCSDSNLCTTDSCDPATGCANDPVICDAPDLCTVSACAPDTGECVESPVSCPDGFACDLASGDCVPDTANQCPCWDTDELLSVTAANNLIGDTCSTRPDVDALIQNIRGSTPGVEGGFAADTGGYSGAPRCDTRDFPPSNLAISLEEAEACIAEIKQRCADVGDPIPESLTESAPARGSLWGLE
jgi:hypothetical protein